MTRLRALAFLGSFLAFWLELAAAKLLLPRLGGSAAVWTGCLMVFQGMLLAGYAWSAAARRRPALEKAHAALVLGAALLPALRLPPALGAGPMAELAWGLLLAAGPAFFLLSATAPTAQSWSERERPGGDWSLYAWSNLGALAALLAFPLLLEPLLSLRAQGWAWRALFTAYAALFLAAFPRASAAAPAPDPSPSAREAAAWLLLAAAPCAAMAASANMLGFEFAAVPLLWTVPLGLYLLTFVLGFRGGRSRLLPGLLAIVAACVVAASLVDPGSEPSMTLRALRKLLGIARFGAIAAGLYTVGLVCHRSLYALRPPSGSGALFYLLIGLGGWLGTSAVALGAPILGRSLGALGLDWALTGVLAGAALVARDWEGLTRTPARRAALAAAALAWLGSAAVSAVPKTGTVHAVRNFYGVWCVRDGGGLRTLYHGNTDHGAQSLDSARRREPVTYYGRSSPAAEAIAELTPRAMGIVGMGAGGLAAYGRPGAEIEFYELDADVVDIARRRFTFLADSAAEIRVTTGDARLSLERRAGPPHDLLVLDAFSSGAIPAHLLTKEALALYLRRLTPDGAILLHVSNRHLDLRRPAAAAARELGLSGAGKTVPFVKPGSGERPSAWIILARDGRRLEGLRKKGWEPLLDGGRAWTDEHASLLSALSF